MNQQRTTAQLIMEGVSLAATFFLMYQVNPDFREAIDRAWWGLCRRARIAVQTYEEYIDAADVRAVLDHAEHLTRSAADETEGDGGH